MWKVLYLKAVFFNTGLVTPRGVIWNSRKLILKKITDKIIIYKIMIKDTTQSSIKQLHSVTITKINQCSIYKYLIDISKHVTAQVTATKRSLGSLA